MYRKYKKYYFILYGVVVLFLVSACKSKEESGMFVYELKKSTGSMENFRSTVQTLNGNLNGNFQRDSDGSLMFYVDEKNDTYFEQNLSNGNLSFNRNMQNYLGDYRPELPAENQLKDISFEFLKKNELMPKSIDEFHLIHSGGLRADLVNGDGVIDKMRTLTFGRTINGIPVIGSGSKIVLNIGDKGEITGLIHKWRELEQDNKRPVNSEEIISKEEAEANFQNIITTEFGKDAKAKIKNLKLVYYDGDGNFIQPVYGIESIVTIKLSDNETSIIPYLAVVTAMKNPPEEINLREVSKDALRLVQKSLDEKGIPGIKESRD